MWSPRYVMMYQNKLGLFQPASRSIKMTSFQWSCTISLTYASGKQENSPVANRNVGITILNHPFGNGLYQLSMVRWSIIVIPTLSDFDVWSSPVPYSKVITQHVAVSLDRLEDGTFQPLLSQFFWRLRPTVRMCTYNWLYHILPGVSAKICKTHFVMIIWPHIL